MDSKNENDSREIQMVREAKTERNRINEVMVAYAADMLDEHASFDCSPPSSVEESCHVAKRRRLSDHVQPQPQNFNYLSKHSALYVYVGGLLRPIWSQKCVDLPQCESTISLENCAKISRRLSALKSFLKSVPKSRMSHFGSVIRLNSDLHELRQLFEQTIVEEKRCIDALLTFINHTCEVLELWKILCKHQFTALIRDQQNTLAAFTFRDLFVSGADTCASLIEALVSSYLDDNKPVESISSKLRHNCPNMYRHEDAVVHEVVEILRSTQTCDALDERQKKFRMALQLSKDNAHDIPLNRVCSHFIRVKFYEGVIQLCATCATRRDANDDALRFYRNNNPIEDGLGFAAYNVRKNCYKEVKLMIDHIHQNENATDTPSTSGNDRNPNSVLTQTMAMALEMGDRLMHHAIYEWMLSHQFICELLDIKCPSLGEFLVRSVLKVPDDRELVDVLWRYYECNGRYSATTEILIELASLPNVRLTLSDRIDDLAGAINDGCGVGNGISLKQLEDILEIARVQKTILDELSTRTDPDAQSGCQSLNQQLFTIKQLHVDFVERFDMSECKTNIFQFKMLKTICIEEKELIDLNDDCLMAVFERLPLLDLANVADVCGRFREIARETFRLAKPTVKIPEDCYRQAMAAAQRKNVHGVSRILRNFGALVTEVEIYETQTGCPFDERIFHLLIKHCSTSLTGLELRLRRIEIPNEMRPTMQNLKKFELIGRPRDPSIFLWLNRVEDLTIDAQSEYNEQMRSHLFEIAFEKLDCISLKDLEMQCSDFITFLINNRTLKRIELEGVEILDKRPFDLFGGNSFSIEKIDLLMHDDCFNRMKPSGFANLKNLQTLVLRAYKDHPKNVKVEAILREIIGADIPLKHLTLEYIALKMNTSEGRDLINALSKLEHLETLKLMDPVYNNVKEIERISPQLVRLEEIEFDFDSYDDRLLVDEMKTLARCFPNMRHLAVWVDMYGYGGKRYEFDSNAFEEVAAIVLDRRNETPLRIRLSKETYDIQVPSELAQAHRHILTVEYYN